MVQIVKICIAGWGFFQNDLKCLSFNLFPCTKQKRHVCTCVGFGVSPSLFLLICLLLAGFPPDKLKTGAASLLPACSSVTWGAGGTGVPAAVTPPPSPALLLGTGGLWEQVGRREAAPGACRGRGLVVGHGLLLLFLSSPADQTLRLGVGMFVQALQESKSELAIAEASPGALETRGKKLPL